MTEHVYNLLVSVSSQLKQKTVSKKQFLTQTIDMKKKATAAILQFRNFKFFSAINKKKNMKLHLRLQIEFAVFGFHNIGKVEF